MDNPSTESSTSPLNVDGAAAAFADILAPKDAQANEEAQQAKPVEWLKPQQAVQRTGGMSADNPLYR